MSMELFNNKYKNDIIGKAKTYKIAGLDWQDIAQELDITLWQKLSKFEGRNNATEKTFAMKVMRNRIIDLAKMVNRKKRFANNNHLPLENIQKIVNGKEVKLDIEDPRWQKVFVQNIQNPVGAIWE